MAKVNMQYTKNAQDFKSSLIKQAGQHRSCCTFENFSSKINTLWDAVLHEQFLFSFKNTLEVIVRKEYDSKHSEWDAKFRLDFFKVGS